MIKKQTFTNADIENDIRNSLKYHKEFSKSEYTKLKVCAFIGALILIVVEFIEPKFILWFLLAYLVISIVTVIFTFANKKHKQNRVSINNYTISLETVSHTKYEEYVQVYYKHHARTVVICSISFENGKIWLIPKDNYLWSEELKMSNFAIYNSSHRGDRFIVVTNNETGKIVMAYNTELFEFRKQIYFEPTIKETENDKNTLTKKDIKDSLLSLCKADIFHNICFFISLSAVCLPISALCIYTLLYEPSGENLIAKLAQLFMLFSSVFSLYQVYTLFF